jgi:hypothetical protein
LPTRTIDRRSGLDVLARDTLDVVGVIACTRSRNVLISSSGSS